MRSWARPDWLWSADGGPLLAPTVAGRASAVAATLEAVAGCRTRGEHESAAAMALDFAERARPVDAAVVLGAVQRDLLEAPLADAVARALGDVAAAVGDLAGARRAWRAIHRPSPAVVAADLGAAGALGRPLDPLPGADPGALEVAIALAWGAGDVASLVGLGDRAIATGPAAAARAAYGALADLALAEGQAAAAAQFLDQVDTMGAGTDPRNVRARCRWQIRHGGPDARRAAIDALRGTLAEAVHRGDRYAQAAIRLILAEGLAPINDYAAGVHALVAHGIAREGGYRALAGRAAAVAALLGRSVPDPPPSSDGEAAVLWWAAGSAGGPDPLWPSLPDLDPVGHSLTALAELAEGCRPHVLELLRAGWRRRGVDLARRGGGQAIVLDPAEAKLHTASGVAAFGGSRLLYRLLCTIALRGPDLDREGLFEAVWDEAYRPPSSDTKLHTAVKRVRSRLPAGAPLPEPLPSGSYALHADPLVLQIDPPPGRPARSDRGPRIDLVGPDDPFVGRGADLDQVSAALAADGAVVLWGPGGVGKSRLATEVGRMQRESWPGGVILRDMTGCTDPVADLAGALGAPPQPVEALGAWLADQGRTLIILDGIDAGPEAVVELVAVCRTLAPEVAILATCRAATALSGLTPIEVTPLAPRSARRLFGARARRILGRPLQPDEIDAIAVPTNPWMIEMMASRLDRCPIPAIGADEVGTLADAVARSLTVLTPPQRRALGLLSVFVGPFDEAAAAAVLDLGLVDSRGMLTILQRRALIQHRDRRWRVYDGVRPVALAEIDGLDAARRRHAAAVVQRAEALATQLWGGDEVAAARRALGALRGDLEAALGTVASEDRPLGARIAWLLDQLDRVGVAPSIRRAALLPHLDPTPHRDRIRLALADAAYAARDAAQVAQRCAEVLADSSDPAEIGEAHVYLAKLAFSTSAIDAATDEIRRHLDQIAVDQPRLRGRGLRILAESLMRDGRGNEGEEALLTSVALHRGAGDHSGMAESNNLLANLRMQQGQWERSLELFREAIRQHTAVADPRRLRYSVHGLGSLLAHLGRYPEALDQYRQAIEIGRDLDDRRFVFITLANRAMVEIHLGDPTAAVATLFEAVALVHGLPPTRNLAMVWCTVAIAKQELGQLEAAHHYLDRAEGLEVELDALTSGVLHNLRGALAHEQGDLPEALVAYRRAEAVFSPSTHQRHLGLLHGRMGALAAVQGDRTEAMRCFTRATRLLRGNRDVYGERTVAVHRLHLGSAEAARQAVSDLVAPDCADAELRLAIRLLGFEAPTD